ncbi:MAG: glycosyltransferase involved in cell wall biosynthesis [Parasphingorhabdus sp.]
MRPAIAGCLKAPKTLLIMRILFLAPHPFFQDRGTPIAVKLVLEWMSKAGHEVTLITFPEGQDIKLPGLTIVRVRKIAGANNVKPGFSGKKLIYDGLLWWSARQQLKRQRFDLIHAVEESAFIARQLGSGRKIPYVYDMDSSLAQQMCEKMPALDSLSWFFRRAENWAINGAAGILPVCRALEEIVSQARPGALIQRLEDISLLPSTSQDEAKEVEQLPDVPADSVRFLYVGNLESYQGIDLMLQSFALAVKKNQRLRLCIIGGAKADIETYSSKCEGLSIVAQVAFLGPRPAANLASYLAQADVLVSARSKGINTPMKIYSYLDSGRVVLATRMLTHTQVLDDTISCLVEPDPESMANGMCHLAENASLRQQLSGAAKQRVKEEFSRPAYDRKLTQFYNQLTQYIQTKAN